MRKIRLQVKGGDLVTYGFIPPFMYRHDGYAGMPAVVVWEMRHFLLSVKDGTVECETRSYGHAFVGRPLSADIPIYNEVFAVALVLADEGIGDDAD